MNCNNYNINYVPLAEIEQYLEENMLNIIFIYLFILCYINRYNFYR